MKAQGLWVDDEPATMRFETRLAEALGLEVSQALTAKDALDMSRDTCFRLVLLDLILPGDEYERDRGVVQAEAGLSVLDGLRDPARNAATPPDVRIVVVTAVVSADVRARALSLLKKADDYFTKSVHRSGQDFDTALKRILAEEGIEGTR